MTPEKKNLQTWAAMHLIVTVLILVQIVLNNHSILYAVPSSILAFGTWLWSTEK